MQWRNAQELSGTFFDRNPGHGTNYDRAREWFRSYVVFFLSLVKIKQPCFGPSCHGGGIERTDRLFCFSLMVCDTKNRVGAHIVALHKH